MFEKAAYWAVTITVHFIVVPAVMAYAAASVVIRGLGVRPRKATDAVNVGSYD